MVEYQELNDSLIDFAELLKHKDDEVMPSFEAFMLLIKGLPKEALDNLCKILVKQFEVYKLDEQECYKLLQGDSVPGFTCSEEFKRKVLEIAYKIAAGEIEITLDDGSKIRPNTLGNEVNDKGFNTTSWISHSLNMAKASRTIALMLGIENPEKAETLGLLHDIGRKKIHSLQHVLEGAKILIAEGRYREAIATITHSFFKGKREASCEIARSDVYIDDEGCLQYKDEERDDVGKFLEEYGEYSIEDIILNMADLMAINEEIVSPFERIADISSRKKVDLRNRPYLLATFSNTMIDMMRKMGVDIPEDIMPIHANMEYGQILRVFSEISNVFFEKFNMAREDPEGFRNNPRFKEGFSSLDSMINWPRNPNEIRINDKQVLRKLGIKENSNEVLTIDLNGVIRYYIEGNNGLEARPRRTRTIDQLSETVDTIEIDDKLGVFAKYFSKIRESKEITFDGAKNVKDKYEVVHDER